jgi:hypothetical protein
VAQCGEKAPKQMIDGWFSLLIITLMASIGGLGVLLIDRNHGESLRQPEKARTKSTSDPRLQ